MIHHTYLQWRQYFTAVSASVLAICMGLNTGWTSPMEQFLTSSTPPVGERPMSLEDISWLGSIAYLGSMLGSCFWGYLTDRFGRKIAPCLVAVPFIIGFTMILCAPDFESLLVARFITGMGNSGAVVTVPAFISDIARDDLRGCLGCFVKIFQNFGVFLAYVVGTYFKYVGLSIFSLSISLLFLLSFVWMPETPFFYFKSGETTEAERSFLWYRNGDRTGMEKLFSSYKSADENSKKVPFSLLWATRGNRKALIIGVGIAFARQASATSILISYAGYIMKATDFSTDAAQFAIALVSLQLFFSCFSSFLVDRIGRKPLFVGGLALIGLCLFSIGAYLKEIDVMEETLYGKWIISSLFVLHVAIQSIGIGPICNVVKSEIFTPEVKGTAMSLICMTSTLFHFLAVKTFPFIEQSLHLYGCFWLYGIFSILMSLFFSIYLPETKGLSQNDILQIFDCGHSCLSSKTAQDKTLKPTSKNIVSISLQ